MGSITKETLATAIENSSWCLQMVLDLHVSHFANLSLSIGIKDCYIFFWWSCKSWLKSAESMIAVHCQNWNISWERFVSSVTLLMVQPSVWRHKILRGVTTQKSTINNFTIMRTSNSFSFIRDVISQIIKSRNMFQFFIINAYLAFDWFHPFTYIWPTQNLKNVWNKNRYFKWILMVVVCDYVWDTEVS
jgi:hypothetical protein